MAVIRKAGNLGRLCDAPRWMGKLAGRITKYRSQKQLIRGESSITGKKERENKRAENPVLTK